uniref:Fatty acid desaturase domain-containing protein n=1 Tax=Ciona savignyi TaxID=51511 RepID=H2Z7S6_CIOSA
MSWVAALLYNFSTPSSAAFVYVCAAMMQGVLHVQLILNHYCKRFYTKEEHHSMDYYRAMIEANLNITCPVWMDWFHGGLNFHHEHHCFPRLPRNRMREVSSMIREICKTHNVHYDECSFSTALRRTLINMFQKSKQFTEATAS